MKNCELGYLIPCVCTRPSEPCPHVCLEQSLKHAKPHAHKPYSSCWEHRLCPITLLSTCICAGLGVQCFSFSEASVPEKGKSKGFWGSWGGATNSTGGGSTSGGGISDDVS